MHIKLIDGQPQPYSLGQLRRDNPQVSFPETIRAASLAKHDVYEVAATDPPIYDDSAYNIEPNIELMDGVWTQTWVLVEHTAEDIDRQWANIRSERNQYLAACDWTQLADAPVDDTAWAAYRQDLRDITNQTNPFNIEWPEKPV